MSEGLNTSTDRLQIGKISNPHRKKLPCAEKREGIVGLVMSVSQLKNISPIGLQSVSVEVFSTGETVSLSVVLESRYSDIQTKLNYFSIKIDIKTLCF